MLGAHAFRTYTLDTTNDVRLFRSLRVARGYKDARRPRKNKKWEYVGASCVEDAVRAFHRRH